MPLLLDRSCLFLNSIQIILPLTYPLCVGGTTGHLWYYQRKGKSFTWWHCSDSPCHAQRPLLPRNWCLKTERLSNFVSRKVSTSNCTSLTTNLKRNGKDTLEVSGQDLLRGRPVSIPWPFSHQAKKYSRGSPNSSSVN